jgi:hypothetical protein
MLQIPGSICLRVIGNHPRPTPTSHLQNVLNVEPIHRLADKFQVVNVSELSVTNPGVPPPAKLSKRRAHPPSCWQIPGSKCLRVIGNHPRPTHTSHLQNILHVEPIHRLADKFFAHCPSHPNPLVKQIGNCTLADLTNLYTKRQT